MELTNNEFKITYIGTVDSTVIENSKNKPIDFKNKNIENIIPGKEYYGFFSAAISGEYGYEIHKNLKTDKDELKIYLECSNSSVEILTDKFYTFTQRNWTSGLFPDNLPDNCLRKWSKTAPFHVKYKALESASVLKTNDIKLKYKIITLK